MRRRQKDHKKYPPTTRPSPHLSDFPERDYQLETRTVTEDIREQLRSVLEELEHNRLTSDLEVQKRLLLEQQLKNARQENDEQKAEIEQLRKELSKLSKKYSKMKEKKECDKCKTQEDLSRKLQKEREIYGNDRKIMQDEIKALKNEVQSAQAVQERDRLLVLTDSLYKEVQVSNKKIQQQARIIHFLNDKLSQFEIQNVQIMKNVDILESKLSEVEIESIVRKKRLCQNCNGHMKKRGEDHHENVSRSRQRRNGSIQNIRKTQRDDYGSELQRYEP